jgi:hypothetical protein
MEPERGRETGEKKRRQWRIRKNRERKNRGGRELGFPKDLCVILENCRDLSVKHKFHINLKP